jgi:hypothetical protein
VTRAVVLGAGLSVFFVLIGFGVSVGYGVVFVSPCLVVVSQD